MRLFGIVLLLLVGVPALLVGLATLGTPSPCVDRDSAAAAPSTFDFAALLRQAATGGSASVAISEAQATAMTRVALARSSELPVTDVQLFFCPDGHAEVTGRVTVAGWSFDTLVEAQVDSTAAPPAVEARALRVGRLPSGFTSWLLVLAPGGARRELPLPPGASLRIEDGRAVLSGGLSGSIPGGLGR